MAGVCVDIVLEILCYLDAPDLVSASLVSHLFRDTAWLWLLKNILWRSEEQALLCCSVVQRHQLARLTSSITIFFALSSPATHQKAYSFETFAQSWRAVLAHLSYFPNLSKLTIINAPFHSNVFHYLPRCPSLTKVALQNCQLKPLSVSTLNSFRHSSIRELVFDSNVTTPAPLRCFYHDNASSYLHPMALAHNLREQLTILRINYGGHFIAGSLDQLSFPALEVLELLPGPSMCREIDTILQFVGSCQSLRSLVMGFYPRPWTPVMTTNCRHVSLPSLTLFDGDYRFASLVLPYNPVQVAHVDISRMAPPPFGGTGAAPCLSGTKNLTHLSFTLKNWNSGIFQHALFSNPTLQSLSLTFSQDVPSKELLLSAKNGLPNVAYSLSSLRLYYISQQPLLPPSSKIEGLVQSCDHSWIDFTMSKASGNATQYLSEDDALCILDAWRRELPKLITAQFDLQSLWRVNANGVWTMT